MKKLILGTLGSFAVSTSVALTSFVQACVTQDFELPAQVYSEEEAVINLKIYEEKLEVAKGIVKEELEKITQVDRTEKEIINFKLNNKNFQWEACLEMIVVAFNYKISLFEEFKNEQNNSGYEESGEAHQNLLDNLIETCKKDFENLYTIAKNKEFYSKSTLNYIKSLVAWVIEGF